MENLKGALAGGLNEALAGSVLPMVNGWIDELTAAFEEGGTPALIDTLGTVLQEALGFIAEQLPMVVGTGMSILTALLEGIIKVLPQVAETAVTLIIALVEAIIEALPSLLEAAIQIITTLVSGIGEALPELIPAAVEMLAALVQGLVDNLPLLLDAALPQIIAAIVSAIGGAIPQLVQAGIQLLTALVRNRRRLFPQSSQQSHRLFLGLCLLLVRVFRRWPRRAKTSSTDCGTVSSPWRGGCGIRSLTGQAGFGTRSLASLASTHHLARWPGQDGCLSKASQAPSARTATRLSPQLQSSRATR